MRATCAAPTFACPPSAGHDPSLGRYTQPDPLGFIDGPSVYAYARNNPQAFVDPDGRQLFRVGPLPPSVTAPRLPPLTRPLPGPVIPPNMDPRPKEPGPGREDPERCNLKSSKNLPSGGRRCLYYCPKSGSLLVTTTDPAKPLCHPYIIRPSMIQFNLGKPQPNRCIK